MSLLLTGRMADLTSLASMATPSLILRFFCSNCRNVALEIKKRFIPRAWVPKENGALILIAIQVQMTNYLL
jgi:hypothetical protein